MAGRSGESKALVHLAVLAVLIAVLGGLVYAKWDELKAQIFPKKPPKVAARPAEPVKPVEPAKPAEPVKPAEPAKPVEPARRFDPEVDKAARQLIASGEKLLSDGDFTLARNRFMDAAGLKCSDETRELARQFGVRADVYDNLTAPVAKNPEATGKLHLVRLLDGTEFEGVIEQDTASHYKIRKDSGIGVPVPKDQVDKITPISAETQRKRLVKRLADLERDIGPDSGVEYYQLAEFAWSNNLIGQSVELLDKAYKADPGLQQAVMDDKAGRLLARAIWRDAANSVFWARKFCNQIIDKYPKSKHVGSAKELLAGIEQRDKKKKEGLYKETVTISGGRDVGVTKVERKLAIKPPQERKVVVTAARIAVGSGRATAKLREADGVFNQALDHYKKGRPGSPNFNHHLAQAATLFDKAFDIYEAAQKMEPNNRMIDNRMTDCQKYGYHARKMQTLGGF